MADILGVAQALDSNVAEKIYDDALSKAAKQFGEFGEDFIKVVRLVFFPIQIFAAMQNRFDKTLKRICDEVPLERRITPPPLQIVGPIIESTRYLNDNTVLYEMFEELLARSIDSERIAEAHPSFIQIISQLSHDEAVILKGFKNNDFEVIEKLPNSDHNGLDLIDRKITKFELSIVPKESLLLSLLYKNNKKMYFSHLISLSLIEWVHLFNVKDGNFKHSKLVLTTFGNFFVNACIPEGGFKNK